MRSDGKRGRTRRRRKKQVLSTLRGAHQLQQPIRLQGPFIPLDPRFRGRKAALCAPHLPVPSFLPSQSLHQWICRTPRLRISTAFPAARGAQRLHEYARLFHRRFAPGFHRSVNTAPLHNHSRYVRHYHHPIRRPRHPFAHGIGAVVTMRVAGARVRRRAHVRHRLS